MPTSGIQVKTAPSTTAIQRRSYDHRLRLAVAAAGDAGLFGDLDIPPSTRRSWTTRPVPNVVALHAQDRELVELQVALARVEAANAKPRAVIKLLPRIWVEFHSTQHLFLCTSELSQSLST